MSAVEQVMTVSRNGQVSIPAQTRARWNTQRVLVVDLGDFVVMRPADDDPVTAMRGKYAGAGPSSDELRRRSRREESQRAARHA